MRRLFARLWWLLTGRAKRSCGACACWVPIPGVVQRGRTVGTCRARALTRLDAGRLQRDDLPRSGQPLSANDHWCWHDFVPR